jgi:hypothetical protein
LIVEIEGMKREDEMDGTIVEPKRRWFASCLGTKGVEVRLLYVSCFCFITAQYVVNQRPWNIGFRMVALLALIVAQIVGLRARRG